jgi:hypothetical protein
MSSRELLEEAMEELAKLGCLVERARGDERLLIVYLDEGVERQAVLLIGLIDPAARAVPPPGAGGLHSA